jgi:hypothetical protein
MKRYIKTDLKKQDEINLAQNRDKNRVMNLHGA